MNPQENQHQHQHQHRIIAWSSPNLSEDESQQQIQELQACWSGGSSEEGEGGHGLVQFVDDVDDVGEWDQVEGLGSCCGQDPADGQGDIGQVTNVIENAADCNTPACDTQFLQQLVYEQKPVIGVELKSDEQIANGNGITKQEEIESIGPQKMPDPVIAETVPIYEQQQIQNRKQQKEEPQIQQGCRPQKQEQSAQPQQQQSQKMSQKQEQSSRSSARPAPTGSLFPAMVITIVLLLICTHQPIMHSMSIVLANLGTALTMVGMGVGLTWILAIENQMSNRQVHSQICTQHK